MRRALHALAALVALAGCASGGPRGERAYAAALPPEVRASYDVFAARCSKCHSLARPLDSGIDDDAYWALYVERMRRQPSSGISPADRAPILAFLHYYAAEQRAKRGRGPSEPDASTDASGGAP
jgi:hypothetical protein